MWCLAEALCLLRIIMFLGIAYDFGNLFNDIRGKTSASPGFRSAEPKNYFNQAASANQSLPVIDWREIDL